MRITVLGKSPAWQDAGGACSGYLVEEGGTCVLLDCGNGVFGKLRQVVDYVAVDAVGSEQTCADAVLALRRRGRLAQVGLLPPVDGHPRVPMARVIGWELDVLVSHGMAAADYPAMMALIEAGDLRPQLLVERVIGLDEAAALLPVFDAATVAGMTIVDPTT